ncbi:MAG: hydrogenase formation protein HypD [Desulfovibrionaceae bacterium]|jgi:hydrogenase expression/formation protein HypD|nr:hydrogenase formation protein HypD [Desulfovibrionaceae bacterium]
MKYVDDFRRGSWAQALARHICAEVRADRRYRLMEFCGGHTHAIARYGLTALLPDNIELIHGPGCPVCVLPIGRIDGVIRLAKEGAVTLCVYGDVLRVPASGGMSLYHARAAGADVRVVYSSADALDLARREPTREVVFFSLGFETTTPPTAVALRVAREENLRNFSVYCNHVLTPAAMIHLLRDGSDRLDGFIGPAHVSTVIGAAPYRPIAARYAKPIVVTGFEPIDVLQAVQMLVRQVNEGRAEVENQFTRAVTEQGNLRAQACVAQTMQLRDSFEWRGLGLIPDSALAIRPEFADWDAERRFDMRASGGTDVKACVCGDVLRGLKKPSDCKVFGKACTPSTPLGACMVSSEGACAAYYHYGRFTQSSREKAVGAVA